MSICSSSVLSHILTFLSSISFAKPLPRKKVLILFSSLVTLDSWPFLLGSEFIYFFFWNLSDPNARATSKPSLHLKLSWLSSVSSFVLISQIELSMYSLYKLSSSHKIPQRFLSPFFVLALDACVVSCGLQRLCGQLAWHSVRDEVLQGRKEGSGKASWLKVKYSLVPQRISGNKTALGNCLGNCGFCSCQERVLNSNIFPK